MRFHVSITAAAELDIRDILHWISGRSPSGAKAWFIRWQEVLTYLAERADFCGVAPESQGHPVEIRQIVFKTRRGRPYRGLFVVRDQAVIVLHVRGPSQSLLAADEMRAPGWRSRRIVRPRPWTGTESAVIGNVDSGSSAHRSARDLPCMTATP